MESKSAPKLAERAGNGRQDLTPVTKLEQKYDPKLAEEAEYWRMFYLACLAYVTEPAKRIQLHWLEDINRSSSSSRHRSFSRNN